MFQVMTKELYDSGARSLKFCQTRSRKENFRVVQKTPMLWHRQHPRRRSEPLKTRCLKSDYGAEMDDSVWRLVVWADAKTD